MNNLKSNNTLQGGKYKIIRFISSGGFGCTYEAEHIMLHKRVAIKEFFVKDFCNRDDNTLNVYVATDSKKNLVDKMKRKFCDEAVAISSFNHPHIVKVHDVFEEHNTIYYVMDYITGGSLHDKVKEGRLTAEYAKRYILQICDALKYVHGLNRLHLDIKPGNVMLDDLDNVILIDFGASKQYDEENGENTSSLMGKTPGYAPMEQMGNCLRKFTPATDIYSVGATFFNLLTGTTPPAADIILDEGFPTSELQAAGIDDNLIAVISKAMSVARKDRYQNIDDMIAALNSESLASTLSSDEEKVGENDNENEEKTIIENIKVKQSIKRENITFNVKGIDFDMMYVEGGTFMMGATAEQENEAEDNEKPVHDVTLSDYYIGKTVVTQNLWQAVMGHNSSLHNEGESYPVNNISWDNISEFILRLRKITGKKFMLPTEAQWEFAARGGNKSMGYIYSGSNNIDDVAWYKGNSSENLYPVAKKYPNELGLYDMTGNVWELCNDWYGVYQYNYDRNPIGPKSGSFRVFRGGSIWSHTQKCRVSFRYYDTPNRRGDSIGFRLVLIQ